MYTVNAFDEFVFDTITVFKGTLEQCLKYVKDIDNDEIELYDITAPDGYTTIEW